jgi:uncharacterized membrane protein (UPF0136 family)
MNKIILAFIVRVLFFTGVVFGLHLFILDYRELPLFDHKIILAYAVNVVLAIIIFVTLYLLRHKMKTKIGALYVAGGILKFVFFFALFYPSYKADGTISRIEFFTFFIPYSLLLILEVFSLSKWLNKME